MSSTDKSQISEKCLLFFFYSLALLSWDANNTSLDCHCALESAIKDTFIGPEIFCNNNCLHDSSSSSVSTLKIAAKKCPNPKYENGF